MRKIHIKYYNILYQAIPIRVYAYQTIRYLSALMRPPLPGLIHVHLICVDR